MQSEYTFKLPKGYLAKDGDLHKEGCMRLATAKDEIEATRHPLTKQSPEYTSIVLLSRVVVRLDGVETITPEIIGDLYTADLNFLQNMYQAINENEEPVMEVSCPHCGKRFMEPLDFYRKD